MIIKEYFVSKWGISCIYVRDNKILYNINRYLCFRFCEVIIKLVLEDIMLNIKEYNQNNINNIDKIDNIHNIHNINKSNFIVAICDWE